MLEAVVSCSGTVLRGRKALVSQTLVEVLEEPTESFDTDSTLCARLRTVLPEMAASLRAPLPPAGASLILSLYRRALSVEARGEAMGDIHEAAFTLLCLHCVP